MRQFEVNAANMLPFTGSLDCAQRLSDKAKELAAGQPGYYIVHCPMLEKDWVQTSDKIANPYGGKDMTTCGEIKK